MKKSKKLKTKNQLLVDALGKGFREIYLDENPHGFKKTNNVVKSQKTYNRKKEKFAE